MSIHFFIVVYTVLISLGLESTTGAYEMIVRLESDSVILLLRPVQNGITWELKLSIVVSIGNLILFLINA